MESLFKIRDKTSQNLEIGMELIRVYLGIGLFVKGIHFVSSSSFLISTLVDAGHLDFANTLIAHLVGIGHISGGAMIALGLATRIGALVQIPIVGGALVFVSLPKGLFTQNQSFEFTALVLFLLIVISIFGGGEWSMDRRILLKQESYKLGSR